MGASVEFFANNPHDVPDYEVGELSTSTATARRCATWTSPPRTLRLHLPGLLVPRDRRARPALLLRRGEPLLLPPLRGQRREDHQRRRLRQPDPRRRAGRRSRPAQRHARLVPGADHLHDVHHRLRGRPRRDPPGRRRPVRSVQRRLRGRRQHLGGRQRRSPLRQPHRRDGPSTRKSAVGQPTTRKITATSSRPGRLTYSEHRLPDGLAIDRRPV